MHWPSAHARVMHPYDFCPEAVELDFRHKVHGWMVGMDDVDPHMMDPKMMCCYCYVSFSVLVASSKTYRM